MKNLFFILMSCLAFTAFSQNDLRVNNISIQGNQRSLIQGTAPEEDTSLSSFDGSIYSTENFIHGQILDKLSQKTVNSFLRYDAHNDVFQMNTSASKTGFEYLRKSPEIEVTYSNTTFSQCNFKNKDGEQKIGYLQELLSAENTVIYYRQERKITLPVKAKTSFHSDLNGKITDINYFVVKNDNLAQYQKLSKKNIASFFPEDLQKKVTQITKAEKLKFKDPQDILTLARLLKKS